MGIEAIGSIGSAMGSVASGIGKAGAGVAPALSGFGEVMKAPLGNIVSEGSVRGGFLEGFFRPMNTTTDITTINPGGIIAPSPLGEILFKPSTVKHTVIHQAETVAAAAWGKSELPTPAQPVLQAESIKAITEAVEPRMIKGATYWFTDVPGSKVIRPAEIIMPKIEPTVVEPIIVPWAMPMAEPVVKAEPQLQPATQTENRISAAPAQSPAVLLQPAPAEQEVEEEIVSQKVEEKESEGEEEEFSMKKKIHLVDQPVLTTILSETREAIEKAKYEAERLGLGRKILGFLVARFSPSQHEGNTGGAVKPHGIDGTIIARREAIAGKQEFSSEKDVVAVVFENRPVTVGENGDPATQKEIDTTYLGRVVKPSKVIQIVEIRRRKKIVEKRAQIALSQGTALLRKEPNLEELNPALSEVFPKAA